MSLTATKPRLGSRLESGRSTLGSLHFFDLDFLGDSEQSLLVLGPSPDHQYHVRVYRQRDLPRVKDLREDEALGVLELGRPAAREVASPQVARTEAAGAEKEPQGETDASLQTELEAQFAGSAELAAKVEKMFSDFTPGSCAAEWKPVVDVTTILTSHGGELRAVPLIINAYTCFFGNHGLVSTTLPVQDPVFGGKGPQELTVCSTQFTIEDVRKVTLEHVVESTKIGFSFGLAFMPDLPAIPGTKDQVDTGAKEGEKVFENGKLKKDPVTGSDVTFDFSLAQTHSKLKFQAMQRLKLDVGPEMFVCRTP